MTTRERFEELERVCGDLTKEVLDAIYHVCFFDKAMEIIEEKAGTEDGTIKELIEEAYVNWNASFEELEEMLTDDELSKVIDALEKELM